MGNRNIKIFLIVILTILIVGSVNVFAYGVGVPYWDERPLKIKPGESKDASFTLGPSKDQATTENVIVSLVQGQEIAQLVSGTDYVVSPDGERQKIILRVTIPTSDPLDKEYRIKMSIVSASEGGPGTVQLGVGYDVEFPVIVGEEEIQPIAGQQATPVDIESVKEYGSGKARTVNIILGVIVIIIVIVIIFLIISLVRKKR